MAVLTREQLRNGHVSQGQAVSGTGTATATQGFLEMARATTARGRCAIAKRTFTCRITLGTGSWAVTTTARGSAGVVARGTRRVVVRASARPVAVTG